MSFFEAYCGPADVVHGSCNCEASLMPNRYAAVPVKAENSSTLPVVQNTFGECTGTDLRT